MLIPTRTNISMGATFNGSLNISNEGWTFNPSLWTNQAPQSLVAAGFLACGCQITGGANALFNTYEIITVTPPWLHVYQYYKYTIQVGAGIGTIQTADVYVLLGDYYGATPLGNSLPGGANVVSNPLEVPFEFEITGIWAGTNIKDATPTGRMSPKDYTDRTLETSWYADADTRCTAKVTVPGLGNLTATKMGLGYTNGQVVDAEPNDLNGNFTCGWRLGLNYAPIINTPLVAIGDPKFSESDINLSALPLYNPGTGDQPPDAITAGWYYDPPAGAGWVIKNDGGIALEREISTTTSSVLWEGSTSLPYLVELVFDDGAFNDNPENSLAIQYDCGGWDYVDGSYINHIFDGDEKRTEFHSDFDPAGWRKWSTHTLTATENADWRDVNMEDVAAVDEDGDEITDTAKNDARAGLCVYPINRTDWNAATISEVLWQMITCSLPSTVNINDPPYVSRPTNWVNVSGCTVAGDSWLVTANTTAPKVKRTFATRYWLRLANLQGYSEDPELPRDFNWPIIKLANYDIAGVDDGAVIAAAVPAEDVCHWAEYANVLLGITAPKAGTITMTVRYSTVSVTDPCYSGVAYRAAEWEYTRSQWVVNYEIDVAAGANSIQVDLCTPTENADPFLWHVDEVEFTLLNSEAEAAEQWELTDLQLTRDAVYGQQTLIRMVRCWEWFANKGFGFGAVIDGKDALVVGDAYGYSCHSIEEKLVYIQYAQHNPDSSLTDDPSYAKSLARLVNELLWLGWSASYDIDDADPNPCNEDINGNQQSSAFYWWDLWENHEGSDDVRLGCSKVGTWEMLAGIENKIHITKFPRGMIQGIARSSVGGDRVRDTENAVSIYSRQGSTGAFSLVETVGTDARGRFTSSPLKEYDMQYRVGEDGATLVIKNREYTSIIRLVPRTGGGDAVAMFKHPSGLFNYYATIANDDITVGRLDNGETHEWVACVNKVDTSGHYDAVGGEHDGVTIRIIARRSSDQAIFQWYSNDEGEIWHGPFALSGL